MKISTTLPILLLPFALAHAHGIAPAHHGRRNNSSRNVNPRSGGYGIQERQHSAGLLGGLMDGEESTSTTLRTSSTSTRSTIIPTTTSSSSTSSISTETEDDTTIKVTSRTSTTLIGSATPTPSSSITPSSGVSGSISASSSSHIETVNTTSIANTTYIATSTTSETPSSSSESSAASVQYTTDAAGQTQLVTVILTAAATAAESTASASSSAKPKDDGDAIPVAAIIGISVGAGVVVILLIAFAVWRMKRRNGDEDEAIRWPELNRHGDSDAHHALPARQTGQHGIETNPLSRSLSNSSSIFAPSNVQSNHNNNNNDYGPQPMALNGSSFGATSSLDDHNYSNEKLDLNEHQIGIQSTHSHDDHDNYTSLPPPVQPEQHYSTHNDINDRDSDRDDDPYGGMTMVNNYQNLTLPNPHDQSHQVRPNFRLD